MSLTELNFVKAGAKADYCHYSDNNEISDTWSADPRYEGHICVENIIGLDDKADVRRINGQYYRQKAGRTFGKGNDRRHSRKDKHTNAARNAEAVIEIFVERRIIENGCADV